MGVYHDNKLTYSLLIVHQFLIVMNIAAISPPSYSPDLVPCNFSVLNNENQAQEEMI